MTGKDYMWYDLTYIFRHKVSPQTGEWYTKSCTCMFILLADMSLMLKWVLLYFIIGIELYAANVTANPSLRLLIKYYLALRIIRCRDNVSLNGLS